MRHRDVHDHPIPVINIPDFYTKDILKSRIKDQPSRKPLKLVVGEINFVGSKNDSVRNIHEGIRSPVFLY